VATQIQQRRAKAHNPTAAAAGMALVAVATISGALIIGSLSQRSSQPAWELTNRAISIERPATSGALRFAVQPERMSSQQVVERYGVKSGPLESADDGSYNLAADQFLTKSRYGLKVGILEATGDGSAASAAAPEKVPHGFLP
jgi:hypothetical protein